MSATSVGALIGGAVDALSGDDSAADGALVCAVTANVLKIVLPLAVTYAVGWAVLRSVVELKERVFGGGEKVA
jgi:hypothetical protein